MTEPATSLGGGFISFDISYVDDLRTEYLLAHLEDTDGNVYQGLIGAPVGPFSGVGVLDLAHMNYVGIIPTQSGTGTHSVAAGGANNRIFYPMGEGTAATKNVGNGGICMFQLQ